MGSTKTSTKRSYYNCAKCPAYCCSIYELVEVTKSDLERLAKHFRVSVRTARQQFTKTYQGERILRRKADPIFAEACKFLDPKTRRCTVYEARPAVCRAFPRRARCAFYDLLTFERRYEGETALPLIAITHLNPKT